MFFLHVRIQEIQRTSPEFLQIKQFLGSKKLNRVLIIHIHQVYIEISTTQMIYFYITMFHLFEKKEEERALGIDIGSSAIKVVQLKREDGVIKLETYGEIALGAYAGLVNGKAVRLGEEKTIEAMHSLFAEAKITAKRVAFSVDAASTFLTTISVPKMLPEDIDKMLPFEARKYLPIPVSEVELDHWMMPEGLIHDDARAMQLVLTAVKHDTLGVYSRLAARLGFESPIFEVEGFSLMRSLNIKELPLTLVVDVGAQFTTTTLVHKGVLLDMHVVTRGSQETTVQLSKALALSEEEAEEKKRSLGYNGDSKQEYMQEVMRLSTYPLFGDIGRLLLMYERKYNQVIEGVIFTGGGVRTPGILEAAQEAIRTPIRLATPFETVQTPTFLKDLLARIGPSYSIAVGLALKLLSK